MNDFPLFPDQASSVAPLVDGLYLFLVAVTGAVSLLIWLVIFYFAIKYRRRPDNELAQEQEPPAALEMTWTVVPLIIFIGIFVAGAWVFFRLNRVPSNALEVYATGRQWMWKFQHPSGQREINTLHVPVGRPVKITMASEDVIHSLWFPSFRVKMDVLPSRYRTMWFEATKTGRYHIFCAEYCGTLHSGMIGWVEVMEQTEYQRWLGLARIQIQTASASASAEMTIEGLHEFELVRDFLYSKMRGVRTAKPSQTAALHPDHDLAAALREVAAELRAVREHMERP